MTMIIDGRRLRVFEYFGQLCDYAEWNQENRDFLWKKLLEHDELYEEFVYYLEHHEFCGRLSFGGYSLIDLYVRQMEHYNLIHDIGKNTGNCNKEDMVLRAFYTMAAFFENPAFYKEKLRENPGMDRI